MTVRTADAAVDTVYQLWQERCRAVQAELAASSSPTAVEALDLTLANLLLALLGADDCAVWAREVLEQDARVRLPVLLAVLALN